MEGTAMALKTLQIHGQLWHFDMRKQSDGSMMVVARRDGQQEQVELRVSDTHYDAHTGIVQFLADDQCYSAYVRHDDEQSLVTPRSGAQSLSVIEQEKREVTIVPAKHLASFHSQAGRGVKNGIKSPLAGRVTKVCVACATEVESGTVVCIIESMKMNNEICADQRAFIKNILIEEGNVVQQGQLLIEFEKEGERNATAKSSNEQKAI